MLYKLLVVCVALLVVVNAQSSGVSYCGSSTSHSLTGSGGQFGCDGYADRITVSWSISNADASARYLISWGDSFVTENNYDFVKVYDGSSSSSPLIGSYSGSIIPPDVESTGNSIYIEFTSDNYVNGAGFTGSYNLIQSGLATVGYCGSNTVVDVTANDQEFGCDGYGNSLHTGWLLTGSATERLVLNFDTFNLEANYDYVQVYDGSSSSSDMIASYTGTNLPAAVQASGNTLYVELVSDYSISGSGFTAHFESIVEYADPCYNSTYTVLRNIEGFFGCPYGYGNNVDSAWLIQLPSDFRIEVDFLQFSTETNYDYVKIYDGSDDSATVLATYSGPSIPSTVLSSANNLYITFHSDQSVTQNGFTASYIAMQEVQSGCYQDATYLYSEPSGTFGCDSYSSSVTIEYIIYAQGSYYGYDDDDNRQVVNVEFTSFDLDTHSGDTVTIYDGTTSDTILATYTGNELPASVTGTNGFLTIRFTSDSYEEGTGFSGIYNSIPAPIDQAEVVACTNNFDKTLTQSDGTFGCSSYSNSVHDTWKISVASGYLIQLTFDSFNTEHIYDVLYVYDGDSDSSTLLGSYSGSSRPPALASTGSFIYVVFQSDSSVTRSGFTISYESHAAAVDSTDCSSSNSYSLTNAAGSFGCDGYSANVIVTWSITTAVDSAIQVSFSSFYTENTYDTLSVYDGPSSSSALIGTYSGYSIPSDILSTSNQLYLVFSADYSVNKDGFTAEYVTVASSSTNVNTFASCNNQNTTLTAPAGQFGCDAVENNANTQWLIDVGSSASVSVSFDSFNLENGYDYLRLYSGNSISSSNLLATYTGSSVPSPVSSSASQVLAVLTTDSSVPSTGFVANYVTVATSSASIDCVSSQSFTLTNPSGSFGCDSYSNSVTVDWLIESYNPIVLSFSHINTERSYDTIKVYDGSSTSATLIVNLSGSTSYSDIVSTGNSLYVVFHSDSSVTRNGFSADYATILIN